jgi:hypothetical protein
MKSSFCGRLLPLIGRGDSNDLGLENPAALRLLRRILDFGKSISPRVNSFNPQSAIRNPNER